MTPARTECCSHGFTSGVATGGASWQARSSETRNYRPPPVKAAAQQRAGAVAPTVHAIMSPWRAAQRATLAGQDCLMQKTGYVVIWLLLLQLGGRAGQIGYLWSFDDLRSKSDLVVIAAVVATRDTGIRTVINELQPPFPVVELNTQFKIVSVVKGTSSGEMLVLRHYRLDTDQLRG